MKARTKFEKWVAASNEKLTAIGSKTVEWAVRNVLEHIAFRTSPTEVYLWRLRSEVRLQGKRQVCPLSALWKQVGSERYPQTKVRNIRLFLHFGNDG